MTYWDCLKKERYNTVIAVLTYTVVSYLLNNLSVTSIVVFSIGYPLGLAFIKYLWQS